MADVKKVVLAYSGGLDTSVILKWLQDTYNCEVVTFTADLGQGEEVEPARAKAQAMGVKEIYIDDLREEFVRDFVFPMFRANTVYEGEYLLGTSIARPLIAKRLIEIANATGADAISHGATGKGNDQVRFELGAYALKPGVKVIAPWREWDLLSREKLMDYAEKHAIPIERHGKKKSPYSMDANLLHISYEGGVLEDTWTEHEEEMWRWSVSPENAPDQATYIELTYRNGDIVAIDGVEKSPATVLADLNRIGGANGIGRLDIVENRYVGMKSRGCYETPGGTIMLKAHRAIESITLDREVAHLKDELMPKIRQPDLHRLLVEPGASDAAADDRRFAGQREWRCAPETVQGQCHRGWPQVGRFAVRCQHRHLRRRWRRLQPGGRCRLHQAQRAAYAHCCQQGPFAALIAGLCNKNPGSGWGFFMREEYSRH